MLKVFLFVVGVCLVRGLYFHFEDTPMCLGFPQTDQRMNFVYEIFGQSTENVRVDILQQSGYLVHSFSDPQSSAEFSGN
jgi:hypothetical protein